MIDCVGTRATFVFILAETIYRCVKVERDSTIHGHSFNV